jgi:hypothetical protein
VAYFATNSAWPFERGDLAAEPEMLAFLEQTWGKRAPLTELTSKGCDGADKLPPQHGRLTSIRFFNSGSEPVAIATSNEAGERVALDGPSPNGNIRYLARVGQRFALSAKGGKCLGVYEAAALSTQVTIPR